MKPLRLRMQAFGPYQSVEEIDFTKFNQGLFLITGPTGSGKSTIFDALCFALYHEASGDYKESKMFRSDFAKEDLETWVKLDFSHQGKDYSVYRKPSYLRKKRKSEDYTLAQGEATLTVDGQLIYSGLNEVTKAIEDLLKVKASQFKQIVMIAQGEFLKLLLTKSDERMSIYRRLFNTQIYADFSLRLKEEFLKIEKDYQVLKEDFDKIKQDLNLEEAPTALLEYLQHLQHGIESLYLQKESSTKQYQKIQMQQGAAEKKLGYEEETAQLIGKLDQIKNEDKALKAEAEAFDIKRKKLVKLNYVLKEIKPLVDKMEETRSDYKGSIEQLAHLKAMIAEQEKAIEEYKAEQQLIMEQSADIAAEKIRIHTLSEQVQQYKLYESNKIKLGESDAKLTLYLERKEVGRQQCASLMQHLEQQRTFILSHSSVQERWTLCVHTLKQLAEEEKKYESITELTKKRATAQTKLTHAITAYDACAKKYEDSVHHFYASQAGLLAEKLKDHEACPVCGSTNHPHKAQLIGETVSQEALKALSDEKNRVQELLQNESATLATIEQDLVHYQNMLVYDQKTLFEEEMKKQVLLKEDCEKLAQQLEQTLEKQRVGEEQLKLIQSEQLQNDQLVKETENEHLILKTILEDARLKFTYSNPSETQTVLVQIQKRVANYEENKRTIEANLNEQGTQLALCRGQQASVEPLSQNYFSKLNQLEVEVSNRFPDAKEYQALLAEIGVITTLSQEIEHYDQQVVEGRTRREQLEVLIGGRQRYISEELREELKQLKALITVLETEKEARNIALDLKERYLKQLVSLSKTQGHLEERYALYKPLSDTANAHLSKKARINFEIFVQGMYFMEVLEAANIRLHKMTLARFTLKMREGSGYQSVSGLDLEVFDEYTGKSRDVKTLSGGESFMASLSLALGLSDVIAQKAAGIELECIFIDEGFGTLDTQTLEQALGLLQELVTQNRLVGIISHVDTLKQRIEQKIEIIKEYKGSTLHQVL